MTAKDVRRLKAEVDSWAAETRLLVGACRRLIEYFGTKKELNSWDRAIEAPLKWVSVVVARVDSKRGGPRVIPVYRQHVAFRCSESTAKVISPLAEIVGGPVAAFIYTIREIFPRAEQGGHIQPYGNFSISFADAVTMPLWTAYRHLAPEHWKECFAEQPDKRASRRTPYARRR